MTITIHRPNLLPHRCCVPTRCRGLAAQSRRCPGSFRPSVRPWRPGMRLREDRRMEKTPPFEWRATSFCWRWAASGPHRDLRSVKASVWLRAGTSAGCRMEVLRRDWCLGARTGWEKGRPMPRRATATMWTAPELMTEVCRTELRGNNLPASNLLGLNNQPG